jgi:Ca-activated chloride channel homolog
MKRIALALFAIVVFVGSVCAQSRPRRVGQGSTPSTGPSSGGTRPPVLQGQTGTSSNQRGTEPAANTKSGPEEVGEGDVVRVNTTLVTIPVSVMDRDGRYIPNLKKEDFRLWEDGVEQNVAFFASVDKPFTVVLMIDTSGSTRFKLEEIQDAAIAFVNQLHADDRVMVVSFDDRIRFLTNDFTSDRYRLRQAILQTEPGGGTKLYEAVDIVINQKLDRVQGRKAIVLFTDGVDTTSRHATYDSTLRDAEELDALIYPVQFDTYRDMGGGGWPGPSGGGSGDILGDILGGIFGGGRRGGRGGGGWPGGGGGGVGTSRADYEKANRYLHALADLTGARLYEADNTQNLSYAFANVAEELRRQYSLGYYPNRPAQAGERRQIKVRVNQPNLAVRTRDSYIFNPQGASTAQSDPAAQNAPVLKKKLAQTRTH